MIDFDRPLRPRWIYESLLLATPEQKLTELNKPFESIARELTGKEGKRKVRTVLFRCFVREDDNKTRVRKKFPLKDLSQEMGFDFMIPIYLIYLIGKTDILLKISDHIFRLYRFGNEINVPFLKKKMVENFGERDIVTRATGAFIQTLEFFGVVARENDKIFLKNKLKVTDEQMRIMLQIYCQEIVHSPHISLNHLPEALFGYFDMPNLKILAQKFNGQYWDYQHRTGDEFLMMYDKIG